MPNKRPSPELIAARKWEIAKRYDRKPKVGKRSRGMAAIRVAELTRWLNDAYGEGVELEPSKRSEELIRIFAHHFMALPDGPRRLDAWYRDHCPWMRIQDREYFISEATYCPLRYSADKLAWKLKLTDAKRTELKIRTIGAIDCNKDQRLARRKAKRAERDAARYRRRKRSPSISI